MKLNEGKKPESKQWSHKGTRTRAKGPEPEQRDQNQSKGTRTRAKGPEPLKQIKPLFLDAVELFHPETFLHPSASCGSVFRIIKLMGSGGEAQLSILNVFSEIFGGLEGRAPTLILLSISPSRWWWGVHPLQDCLTSVQEGR